MTNRLCLIAIALATTAQLACSSRTATATQATPPAFVPAQSDAKAIAVIDAMTEKLGGAATFDGLKQIKFEMAYSLNGEVKGQFRHAWDRWNGRHRYEVVDMKTVAEAEREGNPSLVRALVVGYDLFERNKGFVSYGGQPADSAEKKKRIAEAYERWQDDVYKLTFLYKLKDPGVVLKDKGKIKDQSGLCIPACDVVQVTFTDGVGTDVYYLNINETSKMPEVWQKAVKNSAGEEGRLGYKLTAWETIGGLQFPTRLQNLGVEGEIFVFGNIEIGEPDDSLYIPRVI